MSRIEPARLPPDDLDGLEPRWSRLVTTNDSTGVPRTFHVLDNWASAAAPRLTLLCVHGNPSWSYLFRALLHDAPGDVRVVAIDHLDMGFSERTGTTRRLATRVDDLARLTASLEIDGPTITVAHDWGGPISLGWALEHRDQLRGVILMNTAVHQPPGSPAPTVIRMVRSRPLLQPVTTSTTAFIRGAFELSEHRPPSGVRAAFLAPYSTADRRRAIGDFVADIPLEPEHASAEALDEIAAGLAGLDDVPALLLWGAADRVFSDLYLHDLERRLPHADVHRYPKAGHFVSEDTGCLRAALDWVGQLGPRADGDPSIDGDPGATRLLDALAAAAPDQLAIAEMRGVQADVAQLRELVETTASGLVSHGVQPGARVALMIPPGVDLAAALLACWRIGAVVVLVDAGLGPRNMSAAMRSADPDHLIGIPKALAAARALRWPGRPICTEHVDGARRKALGATADLPTLRRTSAAPVPPQPTTDDLAAIAFTSGATGPSKGVQYSHAALAAQRDAIAATYDITAGDRLVAAFAPFALFGPLLGIPSVVPDMDVTAPGTLTAAALGDAVERIGGTVVFASPAALVNVIATSDDLTTAHRRAFDDVRLVLSAGAPVRAETLRAAERLFPNATTATPYGMTECLPVASITLAQIDAAGDGDGVCVGYPIDGVEVAIRAIDGLGRPGGEPTRSAEVTGEIIVRAAHQRTGYDRLWHTTHLATLGHGWHATGDVGHLDADGRIWVGGRLGHVVSTPSGPLTPVAVEQSVEQLVQIEQAAAVGVGPAGTQQLIVVVKPVDTSHAPRLATVETVDAVRAAVSHPIAAVLEVAELPVDHRHNSKVDRTRIATWASSVLAGGRVSAP